MTIEEIFSDLCDKEFGQQQSVNRMMMCYMLLTTEEMWTSTIFSI